MKIIQILLPILNLIRKSWQKDYYLKDKALWPTVYKQSVFLLKLKRIVYSLY